jgi:hypothetical protein
MVIKINIYKKHNNLSFEYKKSLGKFSFSYLSILFYKNMSFLLVECSLNKN